MRLILGDMMMDVVELTRRLVSFDTVNPPGREAEAMRACAKLLSGAGFTCRDIPMGDGRSNLLATRGLTDGKAALGFTGHLDTVPLGARDWRFPPHAATLSDGCIHGRGTTDMKGGVAAFICASLSAPPPPGGIALLITAGEETGSDGARVMVDAGGLPTIGALIVAEPTLNRAVPGHKGALWLRLSAQGVTAHGSMPERGVNAVMCMAHALAALDGIDLGATHPVMGAPTLNLGTIHGGLNTNSVPDFCEATLDLRSVPGVSHADLRAMISARLGPDIEIEPLIDLPAVWTDPAHPWMAAITAHSAAIAGAETVPSAASYFTDASIFTPALGEVATMILGPGDPGLAHQTDEYVSVDRLNEAQSIYTAAISDWNGSHL
ncbi:M20 family metallopeptidase [Antarcticimicrobium sediminis]|uniref:M20 family metallopeptidase n=1 Tax=Antarcticimicrobium sediminis TaxID=2546227 RepID=UPI001FDF1B6D|nr:M20 family metallopeptidase [Antarcticimicrobium sediminis]